MKTIGYFFDSVVDIGAFSVIGCMSGYAVNEFIKWGSAPSFFKKIPQIDLKAAAICAALFALIDRAAHAIFCKIAGDSIANKPLHSAFRIGGSATASIALFNHFAPLAKLGIVDKQIGLAVILTATLIYNLILFQAALFTFRYRGMQRVSEPIEPQGNPVEYF